MVDLTSEMAGLWAALGPSPPHRGRVIQFVASSSGEGVSSVAREFARICAVRARKPVWLIDADLMSPSQMDAVHQDPERFGALGAATASTPDGSTFFTVAPPLKSREGRAVAPARLMLARPALGRRLWVTRFRVETLKAGQRPVMVASDRYWQALRPHADAVIVDTPALDRSDAGLVLAPYVDATVLVLAAESTDVADAGVLRDEIEAAGGEIAGVVLNRSRFEMPGFLRRVSGG